MRQRGDFIPSALLSLMEKQDLGSWNATGWAEAPHISKHMLIPLSILVDVFGVWGIPQEFFGCRNIICIFIYMYSIYLYRHVCVYSPQVVKLGPGVSTVFGIPMAVQKCIVTSKIKQWRHLIWKDGSAFGFGRRCMISPGDLTLRPLNLCPHLHLCIDESSCSWRRWDQFHAIQVYSGTSVSTLNFYMWTSAGFQSAKPAQMLKIFTVLHVPVLLYLPVFVVQTTD